VICYCQGTAALHCVTLQGKAAELGGMCRSLEQQLTYERVSWALVYWWWW
jgi:hypothetical protein